MSRDDSPHTVTVPAQVEPRKGTLHSGARQQVDGKKWRPSYRTRRIEIATVFSKTVPEDAHVHDITSTLTQLRCAAVSI